MRFTQLETSRLSKRTVEDLKADLTKTCGSSDAELIAIAALKKDALIKAISELEVKKARQLEDALVDKWNESVSQFVECFADAEIETDDPESDADADFKTVCLHGPANQQVQVWWKAQHVALSIQRVLIEGRTTGGKLSDQCTDKLFVKMAKASDGNCKPAATTKLFVNSKVPITSDVCMFFVGKVIALPSVLPLNGKISKALSLGLQSKYMSDMSYTLAVQQLDSVAFNCFGFVPVPFQKFLV